MCPPSMQVTEEGSSSRAASSPPPPPQQEHDQQQEQQQLEIPEPQPLLVDIGINPTFEPLQNQWRQIIERAVSANVRTVLLTGTNSRVWEQHEAMVNAWREEGGHDGIIRTTVGVHPCDADTFDPNSTIAEMRQRLTNDTSVVAVGECGLDYCRGQATADLQQSVFREQVALACELQMPLLLHEREAHDDFVAVLDSFPSLPPVVVHCFTGTKEEVMAYIERGFYLGFTGIICKPDRGRALRELLPCVPLDRILVETDAPFMVFKRKQSSLLSDGSQTRQTQKQKRKRYSEPADVVGVVEQAAELLNIPFHDLCRITTANAKRFFRLK